ncbi:MAG: 4Fe-4S binding protein [Oscillospiraceae bacterium]|nr:4Fe-4S binding protein [Oscillospiraceae bacterium]
MDNGRKRKLVQAAAALLMNGNLPGFFQGRIYQGGLKKFCAPGLNCYSCPGALGACPIGSLQALAANPRTLVSFYVCGFLLITGVLTGRFLCGFLCPFGLAQDLLYKIPLKKWRRKRVFRWLAWGKYIALAVFVAGVPAGLALAGEISVPVFCKYICPAGTLGAGIPLAMANESIRGALGWLFAWKLAVLALVILLSMKLFRPFCRFLCPLGALLSLFNRVSLLRIKTDGARCDSCGKCRNACRVEAPHPDHRECVRCGACAAGCPKRAMRWSIKQDRQKQ